MFRSGIELEYGINDNWKYLWVMIIDQVAIYGIIILVWKR